MEVHHHHAGHKKKNFGEYLSEFLMMFLAVTLGFFAENIREHISDRQREKEYIVSLIQNLQDDTVQLKRLINDSSFEKGVDSLLMVSKKNFQKMAVQDSMYYFSVRYLTNKRDFKQNDFTIIQLRNAGGYRYIRRDHVADSIAVYESNNDDLKAQARYYDDAFAARLQLFNQIFDWSIAENFMTTHQRTSKIPADMPALITNDAQKINLYYNQCFEMGFIYQGYKYMLKEHLHYLTRFISFLKKEYDLR